MGKLTGGQVIVKWMEERGINHFFNVPGESFLHIFDALYDSKKVEVLSFRHESGASFAAEAYGKITGKPIVCMATRGPGASNLSIGVQTAYYDGTPMIAMIGQVPRDRYKTGSFQEVDHGDFFSAIAKEVFYVSSAKQLPQVLKQAEWIALEGKPGPVVISLPTDVLAERTEQISFSEIPAVKECADFREIARQVIDQWMESERPVIISSMEAVRGKKAQWLDEIALKLGTPVITGWRRFSSFANDHPNFIGSLGLGGPEVTSEAVMNADLILGFGNSLEDININGGDRLPEHAVIYQISPYLEPGTPRFLDDNELHLVQTDELPFLQSLLEYVNEIDLDTVRKEKMERTEALHKRYLSTMESNVTVKPERSRNDVYFRALNQWIEDDAVIVSDAGNFAHWLLRYIRFAKERVYVGPVNGAMGYSIPAGLGASIATDGKPVWCFAGDGGAMMTIGEMETIARANRNIVVVVINNQIYGTIKAYQQKFFPGRTIGTDLGAVDFSNVAKAMNWQAWLVNKESEIETVLREVMGTGGPRLIELNVEEEPLSLG